MSWMVLSAVVCRGCDFCLIFVPFGHYDEPEILSYPIPLICPIGADVRQPERRLERLNGMTDLPSARIHEKI